MSKDHPRGCGENQSSPNPIHNNIGSPPRMRGKLTCFLPSKQTERITPADAGKTPYGDPIYYDGKDHPRGCGENGRGKK